LYCLKAKIFTDVREEEGFRKTDNNNSTFIMYSSKSLYESTVLYIVKHIELYTFNVPRHDNKVQQICNQHMMSFSQLTPSMRFDIIWELFKSTTNNASSKKTLVLLEQILQDIDTVFELLQMGHHRMKLHVLFEDLQRAKTIARDEVTSSDDSLAHKISTAFVTRTRQTTASIGLHNFGHNLAAFFIRWRLVHGSRECFGCHQGGH